jgi:hypothetical protein
MSIITVGIDLAKNVFAVHGVIRARSRWSDQMSRAISYWR